MKGLLNLSVIIFLLVFFCQPNAALGICASLIKGEAAINISKCGVLNPQKSFPTTVSRYQFIGNLSPQGQRDFFGGHTYQRVDKEGTFHCLWDETHKDIGDLTGRTAGEL